MRTVTFAINISIDGYADHTSFSPDEELMEYFAGLVHDVDLIAYGRKMYELMFPYWADPANSKTKWEIAFARRITELDKIVFSRTLGSAGYHTRIVSTDPAAELRRLKHTAGGKISVDTVSMLPLILEQDLIDEFYFVVHPAIVGRGTRLLDNGSLAEKLNLKLIKSRSFKSGCMALRYTRQMSSV